FDQAVRAAGRKAAVDVWELLREEIYSLEPPKKNFIGYPSEGHVSGYYFGNPTKEEIEKIQVFLESIGLSALNTRLRKTAPTAFEVLVASSIDRVHPGVKQTTHEFDGLTVSITFRDFGEHMKKAALAVRRASLCAGSDVRFAMHQKYAESWESGDMDLHKESQRLWIKDVGPLVECNIGFVETYKDPAGVRAEWEGFVAVVNKEQTAKFERLVTRAEEFLRLLPWPAAFEKDEFRRPDFTSLEVVTFCSGGSPPLGINIPNYDDVRQQDGFKNVSLGNVAAAVPAGGEAAATFVHAADAAAFARWRARAFEVQVGLHELLGHGSGKLLCEAEDGSFNFDRERTLHPDTGRPVETWYRPGQTWGSLFGAAAASYEECRAELVAMALIDNEQILEIFEIEKSEMAEMVHIAYLSMARAGLLALEFYDPESKKWGQAHMQARFGILRAMLSSGVARLEEERDAAGALADLSVRVDAGLIASAGREGVSAFLRDLHVFKATGDAGRGVAYYADRTGLPEPERAAWEERRELVIRKRQPRKVFVQ
ncbi:hypothetical protein HK405_012528, partial [Cladochytrium tenue]